MPRLNLYEVNQLLSTWDGEYGPATLLPMTMKLSGTVAMVDNIKPDRPGVHVDC
jgi:hypothetical protein